MSSRSPVRTPASVAAITLDDVKKFHATHYTRDRLIVGVAATFSFSSALRGEGAGVIDDPESGLTARPVFAQQRHGEAVAGQVVELEVAVRPVQ